MKTMFVLLLLNSLWFGFGFLTISLIARLLFGFPIEMIPQWYWALSSIAIVAGASALTRVIDPRLDRRSTRRPGLSSLLPPDCGRGSSKLQSQPPGPPRHH